MVSARQRRVYSCATAHGFHVIPSWQPWHKADPDGVLCFQSADVLCFSVSQMFCNTFAKVHIFYDIWGKTLMVSRRNQSATV